ncbi:Hsp20/alpha crystallin family protein [Paenibacillaceae bacterium WGS1546]|uniref:Hsp20/alpha crystallin family protein n=1 Tax=Cohnella sp. WGS1546 TaxID=3366810 RepID=UPI00372D5890
MPLIPYEPFRHLDNMRRELDRFFPEDWPLLRGDFAKNLGNISIDVHETDQEVVAKCDIPGLENKEDVSIDIDNNMLTISGTLNRVSESKDERMHRQERYMGRFHRSIGLPASVSAEGVTAVYKNGVLEVRMPKLKGDAKKKIDVQFH